MKDKLSSLNNRIIILTFIAAFFLFLSQVLVFFYNYFNQNNLEKTVALSSDTQIQLLLDIERLKKTEVNFINTKEVGYKESASTILREKLKPYVSVLELSKKNFGEKEHIILIDTVKQSLIKIEKLHAAILKLETDQLLSSTQTLLPTDSGSSSFEVKDYTLENKIFIANVLEPAFEEASNNLSQYFDVKHSLLNKEVVKVKSKIDEHTSYSLIIIFIGLGISLIAAYLIVGDFKKTMGMAAEQLEELSRGGIPDKLTADNSEIGLLIKSANTISENLSKASEFALSIGEGKYDGDFRPASSKDTLSNSLLQMRDKLMKVTEDDKIRNWSVEGIAKIVEIIRSHNHDFKMQVDNILKYLVKYVGASQGGLFILNNEDEHDQFLELKACYAFERKKFVDKRINLGDGLIGQVYLEKETIFMVDIPEDYTSIKSGLGDAYPSSILIVPLKINEEVEGVIELAAFKPFKRHEIEFVEKIGETIASTISSIKTSEKTAFLLESSQEQTEQMRAQEEEMRQNLEELQATQEQMQRKEQEMQQLLDSSIQQKEELEQKTKEMEVSRLEEIKTYQTEIESLKKELAELKK